MKRQTISKGLPWMVLVVAYLMTVMFQALYGMHNLNADVSSDMVLAQLLNEEGSLLSNNWYYSTELRLVSHVPVYQLGMLLFDSWHAVRTFAIAVLLAGAALSLIYVLKGVGLQKCAPYAATAIILPFSGAQDFLFVYGLCYTVWFIVTCLMLGLIFRLNQPKGRKGRLFWIVLISVAGGMGGLRMFMVCSVPLVLACALLALVCLTRSDTLREFKTKQETILFSGALLSLAAMVVGYGINVGVLSRIYQCNDFSETAFQSFDLTSLRIQLEYIASFLGVRTGVKLLSIQGIASVCAVCLLIMLPLSVLMLYGWRRALPVGQRTLILFAVMACATGLGINLVTGAGVIHPYSVAYYLPGLLLFIATLFILVERMPCRMEWVRTGCFLMLTAVLVLEAAVTLRTEKKNTPSTIELAADWLVENGYTQGYSTFWNGSVLTDASDGVLDVYTYYTWNGTELYPWLQKRSHWSEQPEGEVFVYIHGNDYPLTGRPCEQEDHLAWSNGEGSIYIYDSAAEVDALQRAQWSEADPPSGE
ncbi:MAG TPA: hypothetical protein IAC19_09520 [Candidatus Ventricola gallistercoris]|nr:hypothetical protein [Candidatus Ventricola gallistercoris]